MFSTAAAGSGCAAGFAQGAGLPAAAVICFSVMAAGFLLLIALPR